MIFNIISVSFRNLYNFIFFELRNINEIPQYYFTKINYQVNGHIVMLNGSIY